MNIPPPRHRWSVSSERAIEIQRELAGLVTPELPKGASTRFVAGVDAAFPRGKGRCIAAAVLWDRVERRVVEWRIVRRRARFPYVPGLLSFREAPAVLAALRKLERAVDVILCDGHGLAHPRRFGLACHLGVLCELPSVGCAKSVLVGEYHPPSRRRGARSRLRHRGETIGAVVRTREGVRPVFVSVGHRIDLGTAVDLVLDCAVGVRLPEPTRLADRLVAIARSHSCEATPASFGV